MSRPAARRAAPMLLVLLLAAAAPVARANDGAAEVAAGGLRLREERRVSLRKERLSIGPELVRVEYEFVNESKADVVTDVAFPVPEYAYSVAERWYAPFAEFQAWIDDRPIEVATETRAFLGGRDVTREVQSFGLDVATLARVDEAVVRVEPDGRQLPEASLAQIPRLAPAELARLRALGLIGPESDGAEGLWPRWSVRITYHWVQHFPPGQVVRVRHAYRPVTGILNHVSDEKFADACVEPRLARLLQPRIGRFGGGTRWVKYILTTANTWKTPIRDFELTVERLAGAHVSLCWDGKVEPLDDGAFRATARDFTPRRELTVYWFMPVDPALAP